jgi:hypothetical protein
MKKCKYSPVTRYCRSVTKLGTCNGKLSSSKIRLLFLFIQRRFLLPGNGGRKLFSLQIKKPHCRDGNTQHVQDLGERSFLPWHKEALFFLTSFLASFLVTRGARAGEQLTVRPYQVGIGTLTHVPYKCVESDSFNYVRAQFCQTLL